MLKILNRLLTWFETLFEKPKADNSLFISVEDIETKKVAPNAVVYFSNDYFQFKNFYLVIFNDSYYQMELRLSGIKSNDMKHILNICKTLVLHPERFENCKIEKCHHITDTIKDSYIRVEFNGIDNNYKVRNFHYV